jgi:hypothetical protein
MKTRPRFATVYLVLGILSLLVAVSCVALIVLDHTMIAPYFTLFGSLCTTLTSFYYRHAQYEAAKKNTTE